MFDYLFQISDIALFTILCGTSLLFSIIAMFLVRRFVPLKLRYADNAVLGNISALLSIIYGVLAGLTALYLVTNIGNTMNSVQSEANGLANLYRESKWLQEPTQAKIQMEIKTYIKRVMNIEWPRMRRGLLISNDGDMDIEMISAELSHYNLATQRDNLIVKDMLEELKATYNARQERISASYSQLSPEIWIVILLGTMLTIILSYLFGMNFYLHILTVTGVTLMTFSMIFLLVTLDRPFQGQFVIESDVFQPVLSFIEK
jgi:hypothetical protein